jgi:cyclopropane fatty-acyl-phospholipid synthase-like methyltransferase
VSLESAAPTFSYPGPNKVWDAIYQSGQGLRYWPNEELVRFVGRRYGQKGGSGLAVAELGCGNGANLWFLADEGFETWGIDHSSTALARAEALMRRRQLEANLGLGSLGHVVPLPSASFDLVVDIQAFQHLTMEQHLIAYSEAARLLKPGGMFFSVHLSANTSDVGDRGPKLDQWAWKNITCLTAVFPGNGQVCMPPRSVFVDTVEKSGLQVRQIETVRKTYGQRVAEWFVLEADVVKDKQ